MAAFKPEINRLNADELTYELAVRGLTDVGTVEEMRKSLRSLIRLERVTPVLDYPDYPFDFKTDAAALAAKLLEAKALLADFDGGNETVSAKLHTKIAFCLGRANRAKAGTPTEKAARSKLIVEILNLKSDVEKKVKRHDRSLLNDSLGLADLSLAEVSSDEDEESVDLDNSPIPVGPTSNPRPQKLVPVSQWGLKFSGEERDLSLSAFLIRVEELRQARNVSESELFNSAIDLFSGKALIWYRSVKKRAQDWPGLVTLLRKEFQPPDYNDRLFDEIRHRTQGSNESLGLYLAVMDNLFDRLTIKVPETTRLKVILKNLAPFYQGQIGIQPVKSISDLLLIGQYIERRRACLESYAPPPARKSSRLLEPDLAYIDADLVAAVVAPVVPGTSGVNSRPTPINVTCWNCQKPGHTRRDCPESKKRLCFRCGRPDVTVKTCPRCSGNDHRRN